MLGLVVEVDELEEVGVVVDVVEVDDALSDPELHAAAPIMTTAARAMGVRIRRMARG